MSILNSFAAKEKDDREKQKFVNKGVLIEKKDGSYAYNVKKLSSEYNKQLIRERATGIRDAIANPKNVNAGFVRARPNINLSKEQRMLNALFNDKNQFWGNGDVVRIDNTLSTGNGLIKTGSGDRTRRLFLP